MHMVNEMSPNTWSEQLRIVEHRFGSVYSSLHFILVFDIAEVCYSKSVTQTSNSSYKCKWKETKIQTAGFETIM